MNRHVRSVLIRWHGRGGYGAKTAATLLAKAIIDAGGDAQAAPEFGICGVPQELRCHESNARDDKGHKAHKGRREGKGWP